MRATISALLGLLVLVATACAGGGPAPEREPATPGGSELSAGGVGTAAGGRTTAVLEAVFRYQFEHNDSALKDGAAVFCLCVPPKGQDPDRELLARFADHRPPVAACSACDVREGRVVERATGKPALSFVVSSVHFLSEGEAEVMGGYREGNLSASGERYRVLLQDGRWTVTDQRQQWIS